MNGLFISQGLRGRGLGWCSAIGFSRKTKPFQDHLANIRVETIVNFDAGTRQPC
jgi:hypothetical protein